MGQYANTSSREFNLGISLSPSYLCVSSLEQDKILGRSWSARIKVDNLIISLEIVDCERLWTVELDNNHLSDEWVDEYLQSNQILYSN